MNNLRQTTIRGEPLATIPEIREWREKMQAISQPSGLHDYFQAHDLCWMCRGRGEQVDGFQSLLEMQRNPRVIPCSVCRGAGVWSGDTT